MAAPTLNYFLFLIFITITVTTITSAYDPTPLQDFCVADFSTPLGTNTRPFPCKDPKTVKSDDFFQAGFNVAAATNNSHRAGLMAASVLTIPGLNTLGFTMVRADLDVNGSFPLHYHQRATELIVVLEGCIEAGFVATDNRHFAKKLSPGDVFVVPVGLIHYVANCGTGKSSGYAVLNSQDPGFSSVSQGVFGTKPPIDPEYLAKAYQLDTNVVKGLQGKNWN